MAETDASAADQADAPKKGGKNKLLLIVGAVVLLLAAGGGAFFFLSGSKDDKGDAAHAGDETAHHGESGHDSGHDSGDHGDHGAGDPAAAAVYYELPPMLVNLNSGGGGANFLKIVVSLELASESDVARLEEVLPRVVDNFQVYLRELRPGDLKGSAGIYRLREELLLRVTAAARPARVRDVLFKEMLVQ